MNACEKRDVFREKTEGLNKNKAEKSKKVTFLIYFCLVFSKCFYGCQCDVLSVETVVVCVDCEGSEGSVVEVRKCPCTVINWSLISVMWVLSLIILEFILINMVPR